MRSQLWYLVVCVGLLLAPGFGMAQEHDPVHEAGTAMAREDTHAGGPEAGEHGGAGGHDEHGADKPVLLQFDPGAAIWTVIVFIALLVVLRLTAWKPILRVLNEREAFIKSSIADAKHEREEAEKLLREYQAQLDRARGEAAALIEKGRQDAEVARQRMIEAARGEAFALTERTKREIALAADDAIKELYERTAELSVQVAGRIISKELTAADHRRLIADSIEAIRADGAVKSN